MGRSSRNFLQDLIAFNEFTKSRVLPIEEARISVADKELTAGGIRVLRTGHRDDAAIVVAIVELSIDAVAWPARAPAGFLGSVLRQRITSLNHKPFDHAMETRAVIKALFRQGLEVLNGLRGNVGPELDDHFSEAGSNDSNFAHVVTGFAVDHLVVTGTSVTDLM